MSATSAGLYAPKFSGNQERQQSSLRNVKLLTLFRITLAISLPIVALLLKNRSHDIHETNNYISKTNHNSGFSSAFVHPIYTLRHLKEGRFFLQSYKSSLNQNVDSKYTSLFARYGDGGLLDAYKGPGFFHLPPLVLALWEPVFFLTDLLNQLVCVKPCHYIHKIGNEHVDERSYCCDETELHSCILEISFGLIFVFVDLLTAYLLMSLSQKMLNLRYEEKSFHSLNCNTYRLLKSHPNKISNDGEKSATHSKKKSNDSISIEYLLSLFAKMDKSFESYEMEMESIMEGRIRPMNGYLFGIPSNTDEDIYNKCIPKTPSSSSISKLQSDLNETKNVKNDNNMETNIMDKTNNSIHQQLGDQTNITTKQTDHNGQTIMPIISIPQYLFLLYFCNPITIASSTFFHSFQGLYFLLYLSCLYSAYTYNGPLSSFLLAIWFHVDFFQPMLHLVPFILLVCRKHGIKKSILGCVGYFLLWSSFLFQTSFLLLSSSGRENQINFYDCDDDGQNNTYFTTMAWYEMIHPHVYKLKNEDISPNLGMSWYFHMQIFDRFKEFYTVLFLSLPIALLIPLSIRLWKYPLDLSILFFFLNTLFDSSLNIQKTVFVLSLLLLSPQNIARMNLTRITVSCLALVVPIQLFIMDYWLWMKTGTGNANYLYFQCLVFTVMLAVVFLDFAFANMKRDKALRLTEKYLKNVIGNLENNIPETHSPNLCDE